MKTEELEAMESRIKKYNYAKAAVTRYEKIRRTLEEIPSGDREYGISYIIVDVLRSEFHYLADDDKRIGASVCALDRDDQTELFNDFLVWAKERISKKIQHFQKVMDEA